MTIFRNPVEGAKLPYRLACEDVDPSTGLFKPGETHACAAKQKDHPKGKRRPFFDCKNRGRYKQGTCDSIGFMYPRRWMNDKSAFHFHQGIDVMAERGTPIQSVTAGTEHAASREYLSGYGGYGMVVVIQSVGPDGEDIWLLYAHCDDVFVTKGKTVVEKQIIASVGTTWTVPVPPVRPPRRWCARLVAWSTREKSWRRR